MFDWRMKDWEVYQAALAAVLSGGNPYLIGWGSNRFFNPPWVLILLLPLLLVPDRITPLAVLLTGLTSIYLVARKFRMGFAPKFFLLSSPMLLYSLGYGNIEWLPWLGLLLPAPLAIVVLSVKPQVTLGVMLVVVLRAWDRRGLAGVITAILPTAILTAIWLALWGLHLPDSSNPGNISLFPWSLMIGVPVLLVALRRRSIRLAAFASPLIMPYATFSNHLGVQFVFPFWGWLVGWIIAALYLIRSL